MTSKHQNSLRTYTTNFPQPLRWTNIHQLQTPKEKKSLTIRKTLGSARRWSIDGQRGRSRSRPTVSTTSNEPVASTSTTTIATSSAASSRINASSQGPAGQLLARKPAASAAARRVVAAGAPPPESPAPRRWPRPTARSSSRRPAGPTRPPICATSSASTGCPPSSRSPRASTAASACPRCRPRACRARPCSCRPVGAGRSSRRPSKLR